MRNVVDSAQFGLSHVSEGIPMDLQVSGTGEGNMLFSYTRTSREHPPTLPPLSL